MASLADDRPKADPRKHVYIVSLTSIICLILVGYKVKWRAGCEENAAVGVHSGILVCALGLGDRVRQGDNHQPVIPPSLLL
jgi:hypothetical protein